MAVRGYRLALDWTRTGDWSGTYDDVTSDCDSNDITLSYGRDPANATSRHETGKLGFSLNNVERRYSPENTASPIAGKVVPGTPAQLQVTSGATIHTLFGGVLDDIKADPTTAAKTVAGSASDGWAQLSARKLSTPVYTGQRTGDAIGLVLDAAGWTGPRDLDPGATLLPYWWAEDVTAADAIDTLIRSEGPPSGAYVEGGVFVFRDRHARITHAESLTSQGTYTHIQPAGSGPAGDYKTLKGSWQYDHGLKAITNSAEFAVGVRRIGDLAEVWASDDPISLASGASLAVFAQASDPFLGAIAPEVDTDVVVASGAVSVTLSRDSGQSAIITLTASADTVITRLALRAYPITVSHTVKLSASDTASISTYGVQAWPDDCGLAGPYDADAIAKRIVALHATNRRKVTFSIAYVYGGPIPGRYLTQILSRRLGDRVTVRNDILGLDEDFIVERITHTIRKLGAIHRIELTCSEVEPGQPDNVFTFNDAARGFDNGSFAVDGIDSPGTVFRFDAAGVGFNQGVFAN